MPSLNTGNAILSNPIKVDSSYNVGIGGAASGSFKLQVTGTTNLTGALSGTSGTFSSLTNGSILKAGASGIISNTSFITETGTGVGFQIANPLSLLHMNGQSGTTGLPSLLLYGEAPSNGQRYGFNVSADQLDISALGTSASIGFYTGGNASSITRRLLISSTGAATFQTTGNNGIINIGGSVYYSQLETNSTLGGLKIKSIWGGANSGIIQFINGTSENVRMHIADNGNIGIGTISPQTKVQINDSGGGAYTIFTIHNRQSRAAGVGARINLLPNSDFTAGVDTGAAISAVNSSGNVNNDTNLIFETSSTGTGIERMRLTSAGNVGIGTANPSGTGIVLNAKGITGNTVSMLIAESADAGCMVSMYSGAGSSDDPSLIFLKNLRFGSGNKDTSGYAERMRLTSGGQLLIGTTTDSGARINARHASSGNPVISATNNVVSSSRCYYGQKAYASTDDYYMIFDNALDNKFLFYGNGGLGNVQGNNVNISDVRTKKDIFPLESYWDKIKAIEIVKFKYKDQTHDDFNIGVIAQQVEAIAPEFIEAEDWGKDTPTQTEEPLKSVYTTDLYHATIKVLQEAMAKIENQQAQIEAQQQQINSLINR